MEDYKKSVEAGSLPIERGIALDGRDILRRAVIMDIMCMLRVDYANYGIDFEKKFGGALKKLEGIKATGSSKSARGDFPSPRSGGCF